MSNNNCVYCNKPGILSSGNLCVCDEKECIQRHLVTPHNNAVTELYNQNKEFLRFLITITYMVANQTQEIMNKLFNPFPWFFKTYDNFKDDVLGMTDIKNRDYDLMRSCMLSSWDDVMKIISNVSTDTELMNILNHNKPYVYQFIKWIVETRNINATYKCISDQTMSFKLFTIQHDSLTESEFDKSDTEFCYLSHGSKIECWHSIIRNGLIVASGSNLMTAGNVHGDGIYFSDSLSMNRSYCGTGTIDGEIVILVCQIQGNMSKYKKTGGIYVVDDPNKILQRHLIVIKVKDVCELDKFKTELYNLHDKIDKKIKFTVQKTAENRIKKDIETLTQSGYTVKYLGDGVLSINADYNGNIVNFIYVCTPQYPFEPPIVVVKSPKVTSNEVSIDGSVMLESLLIGKWSPTIKPNKLLSQVNITEIEPGKYDVNETINKIYAITRNKK